MTDGLEDVRRRVAHALRALDEVTTETFASWRDDVALSFDREFVAPLREAAVQFEKALKVASRLEDEIDSLPTD